MSECVPSRPPRLLNFIAFGSVHQPSPHSQSGAAARRAAPGKPAGGREPAVDTGRGPKAGGEGEKESCPRQQITWPRQSGTRTWATAIWHRRPPSQPSSPFLARSPRGLPQVPRLLASQLNFAGLALLALCGEEARRRAGSGRTNGPTTASGSPAEPLHSPPQPRQPPGPCPNCEPIKQPPDAFMGMVRPAAEMAQESPRCTASEIQQTAGCR